MFLESGSLFLESEMQLARCQCRFLEQELVKKEFGSKIKQESKPEKALVFDSGKPESLMYLLAGLTGLNILAYAGMHLFGNIFGSLPRLRREKSEKEHTF